MEAVELYGLGLEEYEKGNYLEAIEYFERSNNIEEHFKTYERLFLCWKELEKREKANSCLEKAYEMNPNNDKIAFEYAEVCTEAGNIKLAGLVLEKLIERNPTYKKAQVLLERLKGNL